MKFSTKIGKKWNEINFVGQTKIEKWDKFSGRSNCSLSHPNSIVGQFLHAYIVSFSLFLLSHVLISNGIVIWNYHFWVNAPIWWLKPTHNKITRGYYLSIKWSIIWFFWLFISFVSKCFVWWAHVRVILEWAKIYGGVQFEHINWWWCLVMGLVVPHPPKL